MMREQRRIEETGIVLDFLPHGHPLKGGRNAVAQVLGDKFLTLLEVEPKKDVHLTVGEKVFLGRGKKENPESKVHHVISKISYEDLTQSAKIELERIIEKKVEEEEEKYVNFFNKAGPVNIRLHSLELLPGIGKKHMLAILEERRREPFKSYEDISKRIELLPSPQKLIIKRIIEEIQGIDKYKLFT